VIVVRSSSLIANYPSLDTTLQKMRRTTSEVFYEFRVDESYMNSAAANLLLSTSALKFLKHFFTLLDVAYSQGPKKHHYSTISKFYLGMADSDVNNRKISLAMSVETARDENRDVRHSFSKSTIFESSLRIV